MIILHFTQFYNLITFKFKVNIHLIRWAKLFFYEWFHFCFVFLGINKTTVFNSFTTQDDKSDKINHSIRVIPQGTVDNNLGPARLAGPKALDPNYCRQTTLWLHDLCLDFLTVHGIELRLFGAKAFPLFILSRIWQKQQ